ncbi:MAG: hypothetical protein ACI93R_002734 [Flavobacteriales bacterium]|jgi:hypothetical protein
MKNRHTKHEISDEERFAARIALNTHERPITIKVPDKSRFDDYFSNRLTTKEQEAFFEYLEANPEAYRSWLERSKNTQQSPNLIFSRFRVLFNTTKEWGNTVFVSTKVIAYSCSACMVLVISALLLFKPNNSRHTDIELLYSQLQGLNTKKSVLTLILPWEVERDEQAFSQTSQDSPFSLAFAEGLLSARKSLTLGGGLADHTDLVSANSTNKVDASLRIYRELGQWNILLWTLCENQTSIPTELWREQVELAQDFHTAFSNGSAKTVNFHLKTVLQLLISIETSQQPSGLTSKLQRELKQFRQLFSPITLETPRV